MPRNSTTGKRQSRLSGRVRLRAKPLKDGRKSLYLDTYANGRRRYEFLELYLVGQKRVDEETMRSAEALRANREIELATGRAKIRAKHLSRESFVDFFAAMAAEKDTASWRNTLVHLRDFTGGDRTFEDVTEEWLQSFREYLVSGRMMNGGKKVLKANTAREYIVKLKAALRRAARLGKLDHALVETVEGVKPEETSVEFLTFEELQKLNEKECPRDEVRRAFFFGCYTGLRLSDIEQMRWGQLRRGDDGITYYHFRTQKTGTEERLPLSPSAVVQLGDRSDDHSPVFSLPSRVTINSDLVKWCRDAGIHKHIHFHCSRHTFATMALTYGADLFVVSKMLGHSSIEMTQRYSKVVDQRKVEAARMLPAL